MSIRAIRKCNRPVITVCQYKKYQFINNKAVRSCCNSGVCPIKEARNAK